MVTNQKICKRIIILKKIGRKINFQINNLIRSTRMKMKMKILR